MRIVLEMRIVRIQIIMKKYCLTMKSIFDNKCISFFLKKRAILRGEPNPNN